ncbi:alpha-mannosidase [Spirochaetia bacterium]|nr:alpha-mannosidase [Spirochaetia bacterium]
MSGEFKDYYVEKIERQTAYLKQLRYRNIVPIKEFLASDEPADFKYPAVLPPGSSSKKMHIGDFWSGRDRYIWLDCKVKIPNEWKNEEVAGVFDFGTTGDGFNSGFESLLFVDGAPWQGVDSNHLEVFFPGSAGSNLDLNFRLWSGLEGGGVKQDQYHQFKQAFICTLDRSVDELYYLIGNLCETIRILPEDDPAKYQIELILTEGYALVDFTNAGSDAFSKSVQAALNYYNKALKDKAKAKDVSVDFVGHTHIDLAWKWRYKHSREKAERSFSTVLRLMEKYPEYKFLQTQAQLYDSVKQDHPELYKAIRKRVAEGRWEASGAMWVEADCNIPSGESLIRQIIYGKEFFRREFGVENTFLWLPDVFGYSWALPQILKKAGIDTFITTKISWNETNRLPHDTFLWTGLDGTSILTHFITTPDAKGKSLFYTYNGEVYPRTVKGIWSAYQDKALNQNLLFCYGFGDGGGGVTRNMLENIRAISKIPGLPAVRTSTVTDYLEKLHKQIALHNKPDSRVLHTWDKELYLEYHRGTYTSQAAVKKMNRRLELLYRDAEILQSFAAFKNQRWDKTSRNTLTAGWKLILKNQFHDIIPGSSITEVYEDTKQDHEEALALGTEALQAALGDLCGKDEKAFSVINTAGWTRSALARFPRLNKEEILTGEDGAPLITQESGFEGKAATYGFIPSIAALDIQTVRKENKKPGITEKEPFKTGKNTIDTPYYRIRWNKAGQLVSIIDKETDRETLTGPGNQLQIFEDRPRTSDAWEIEANVDQKREIIDTLEKFEVLETGPLFARLRFVWSYGKSNISQDLILYSVHKRIDFKTEADWQERSKLLKAAFPVDVRAANARYDIQNGSLERPTHRSTSWDAAQFEVAGHQWADLSEKDFGVSLLNDSKYGYDVLGNTLRLSLLKSAEFPDPIADKGLHQFTYSLYVHREPWYASGLIPLAWDLNAPLLAVPGKPVLDRFVQFSSADIAVDAIKQSEEGDDVIIRLHEIHGGRAKLNLAFTVPVAGWAETDLLERPLGKFENSAEISKELRPFEIVTYRVKLNQAK